MVASARSWTAIDGAIVTIDDDIDAAAATSVRSVVDLRTSARSTANGSRVDVSRSRTARAKRHGLQGPIDDAFMDRFLMVRPTGTPLNEKVGAWAKGEMAHAIKHWREQFRGEAPVKDDTAVTDADIARQQPRSSGATRRATRSWRRSPTSCRSRGRPDGVRFGRQICTAAENHVPLLIYPNPLNPKQVRRAQQRLHVPRVRLPEQRPADAEAARLGDRGREHAAVARAGRARSSRPGSSTRSGSGT